MIQTMKTQGGHLEQLVEFSKGVVCDGNLLSKYARDDLVTAGLAERVNGWNLITAKGVQYLIDLGFLRP